MSFSFVVTARELPPFDRVLSGAALPWQVGMVDGTPADGWPKGRIAKIADASTARSGPQATAGEEAILTRLGLSLGFLLHAPGKSSRGVEVRRTGESVTVRLFSLASAEDYELAVRFASSLARLAGTTVAAEHGPDGRAVEAMPPDELARVFDRAFADSHGREAAEGLFGMLVRATWHAYGPRGWVALPPAEGRTAAAWRDAAIAKLVSGEAPAPAADASRDAAARLLLGAMAFAVAADGNVSAVEQKALIALSMSVPELRGVDLTATIAAAAPELQRAESHPDWLRRKAYVLAIEALTRGNDGNYTPLHIGIADRLRKVLALDEDFGAAAIAAARRKYVAGDVDASIVQTMVDAMLFVAAVDGNVSEAESLVLSLTLNTVPQFETHDAMALLRTAHGRLHEGVPALLARLKSFGKFKEKTYALVAEVAAAGTPNEATQQALLVLEHTLGTKGELVEQIRIAFAAKYASGPAAPAARSATPAPRIDADSALLELAAEAVKEGQKQVLADVYYFAALVTERKGTRTTRIAKNGFLPHSVDELKELLATELADAERYAITYPGLSFRLGGSVIVGEAGDRTRPRGVRLEQRYEQKTPSSASRLLGEPSPSPFCESFLYDVPPAADRIAFRIESTRTDDGWTVHGCSLDGAAFELRQRTVSELKDRPGVPRMTLAEGRLVANGAWLETFARRAGASAPGGKAVDGTASVVVLNERALREADGFLANCGTWIASKWTFDGTEVYVNLQPSMKRGELRAKESGLAPVVAALAK